MQCNSLICRKPQCIFYKIDKYYFSEEHAQRCNGKELDRQSQHLLVESGETVETTERLSDCVNLCFQSDHTFGFICKSVLFFPDVGEVRERDLKLEKSWKIIEFYKEVVEMWKIWVFCERVSKIKSEKNIVWKWRKLYSLYLSRMTWKSFFITQMLICQERDLNCLLNSESRRSRPEVYVEEPNNRVEYIGIDDCLIRSTTIKQTTRKAVQSFVKTERTHKVDGGNPLAFVKPNDAKPHMWVVF